MRKSIRYSRLQVLTVLLAAACASGGGASEATTPEPGTATDLAIVEVQHNTMDSSSTLTILIEPRSGGIRTSLGTVEPGQTKRFTYNAIPGDYRIIAQGFKNSPYFRLSNREIATWNMQTDRVVPRNK